MIKYLLLFLLCFSCNPKGPAPLDHNELKQIGTVNTNGETCIIEEGVRVYYIWNGISIFTKYETPLVRRILCPSGNNGQSMVTDDGTKFHREVLE